MSAVRSAFGAYVRWRLSHGLDGLFVRGLADAERALAAGPVVFAVSHSSWWDGMALFPLDDALGRRTRVWMDAANLRRLAWFRWFGAMPLDASGAAGLRRSMREAEAFLSGPGRGLWVFPQGRHVPHWRRPLALHRGAEVLARRTGAALVPVGLGYGFVEAPVPRGAASFGAPVPDGGLEAGLAAELDAVDGFLAGAGDPSFPALVPTRARPDQDSLGARLLSWLARG